MNSIGQQPSYANIGKRCMAWLADAVIVGTIIFLGRLIFFSACTQFQIRLAGGKVAMISLAIGMVIAIAYHTFLESSKLQSTPGKLLFNFVVTDLQGARLSKARAFARHISKYASAFTFGVGYLLCFASKKRQCLHDMIAGCVIVQKAPLNYRQS